MQTKATGILAFGAVVLLLIASIGPSVCAGQDNLRSLTVEISGQDIQRRSTINVSETDFQKIKNIFSDVSAKLYTAHSPKEIRQVYWDAVCQLHGLGLLGNLSCEEAFQLVTRWYRPSTALSGFKSIPSSPNQNTFCLVSGRANVSVPTNRIANGLTRFGWNFLFERGFDIGYALYQKYPWIIVLVPIWMLSSVLIVSLGVYLQKLVEINPVSAASLVGIGLWGSQKNYTGPGWVKTSGLLGVKQWEGNLSGILPGYVELNPPFYFFSAMYGFSGIKIILDSSWYKWETSYLGSAVVVGVKELAK